MHSAGRSAFLPPSSPHFTITHKAPVVRRRWKSELRDASLKAACLRDNELFVGVHGAGLNFIRESDRLGAAGSPVMVAGVCRTSFHLSGCVMEAHAPRDPENHQLHATHRFHMLPFLCRKTRMSGQRLLQQRRGFVSVLYRNMRRNAVMAVNAGMKGAGLTTKQLTTQLKCLLHQRQN